MLVGVDNELRTSIIRFLRFLHLVDSVDFVDFLCFLYFPGVSTVRCFQHPGIARPGFKNRDLWFLSLARHFKKANISVMPPQGAVFPLTPQFYPILPVIKRILYSKVQAGGERSKDVADLSDLTKSMSEPGMRVCRRCQGQGLVYWNSLCAQVNRSR